MNDKINIEVYTCCYNESDIMPYFLRHYEQFASKIAVYDNESTDGTADLAQRHPLVELHTFNSSNQAHDGVLNQVYNTCWRGSTADFVICVDTDELICHEDLASFLLQCKANGVMLPKTEGYSIVSDEWIDDDGRQLWQQHTQGFRDSRYDKPCVFSPTLNFNFGIGGHWGWVDGQHSFLLSSFDPLYLMHFKFVGRQRFIDRCHRYVSRLSEYNRINNFGYAGGVPPEEQFDQAKHISRQVIFYK